MSGHVDAERILDAFLAPEHDQLPDRVLEAAFTEIARTPQRPALRLPWRFPDMTALPRALVTAAALVAVVAVGSAFLLSRSGGIGGPVVPTAPPASTLAPTSSPSPFITPTPTDNLDTSTWVEFTSTRYGYSMKRPPTWEVNPGTRDWSLATDRTDWLSPAQDQFIDEQATYQIGVHGFAVDVTGMTADEWIDTYFAGSTTCTVSAATLPGITIDGHAGKLANQQPCSDEIAFVFLDGRMHVFTIGRERQAELFQAFLSTVRFVASPSPPAS